MKLQFLVPSQGNVRIVAIDYILQDEITCFKSLGEQTYNFENKKNYYPTFALSVQIGVLQRISNQRRHLIAFELISPLLYINFPSIECKIF